MKVLHTSDWHLGKKLYKKSRHEEHALFLKWLKETIIKEQINVLIIAGDIFDSPIPPTRALKLYFSFLEEITLLEHLQQVLIIAGNHDSGHFIEAPGIFLQKHKVKVVGRYFSPSLEEDLDPEERHQQWLDHFTYKAPLSDHPKLEVLFGLMPFFKVSDLIHQRPNHEEQQLTAQQLQEQELYRLIDLWQQNLKGEHGGPSIFIAHHLFGQYISAGSEQTVSLSGVDSISCKLFKAWDILALGHIHKKQTVSEQGPLAVYSGSPIPMRFSESMKKSVMVYKLDHQFQWEKRELEIPATRLLKRLTVTESDYQEQLDLVTQQNKELPTFLELTVQLESIDLALIERIRDQARERGLIILNLIQSLGQEELEEHDSIKVEDLFQLSTRELFKQYLEEKTQTAPISPERQQELLDTFDQLTSSERDKRSEMDLS